MYRLSLSFRLGCGGSSFLLWFSHKCASSLCRSSTLKASRQEKPSRSILQLSVRIVCSWLITKDGVPFASSFLSWKCSREKVSRSVRAASCHNPNPFLVKWDQLTCWFAWTGEALTDLKAISSFSILLLSKQKHQRLSIFPIVSPCCNSRLW